MKNQEPKVGDVWRNTDGHSLLRISEVSENDVGGTDTHGKRPRRVKKTTLAKTGRWGWERISTKEEQS